MRERLYRALMLTPSRGLVTLSAKSILLRVIWNQAQALDRSSMERVAAAATPTLRLAGRVQSGIRNLKWQSLMEHAIASPIF